MTSQAVYVSEVAIAFLVLLVLILGCAIVGLFLLWRMARILTRVAAPTMEERLSAIEEQARATRALISDPRHKPLLVRYFLAEVGLQSRLADIEDTFVAFRETDFNERDAEAIVDALAKAWNWPADWWKRGWGWLGRNKGEIAKALLGKLNDLAKSAVTGGAKV